MCRERLEATQFASSEKVPLPPGSPTEPPFLRLSMSVTLTVVLQCTIKAIKGSKVYCKSISEHRKKFKKVF